MKSSAWPLTRQGQGSRPPRLVRLTHVHYVIGSRVPCASRPLIRLRPDGPGPRCRVGSPTCRRSLRDRLVREGGVVEARRGGRCPTAVSPKRNRFSPLPKSTTLERRCPRLHCSVGLSEVTVRVLWSNASTASNDGRGVVRGDASCRLLPQAPSSCLAASRLPALVTACTPD